MNHKTQATNFLLNNNRINLIEHITSEYLSILAILYGTQIESGMKRISDYGSMTMLEAENELRLRTLMIKSQRMRKKQQLQNEHEENERELMEQLKKSQRPAS